MGVRGLPVPPQTVTWLRDYLAEVGPINPYGFVKFLRTSAREVRSQIAPETPAVVREDLNIRAAGFDAAASYPSVMRLFWMLRKVEAIEFDHSEPSGKFQPKNFYRMKDPVWFIPGLQNHFYPQTVLGGRRYRSFVERQLAPPIPDPPPGRTNPERPYERYWEGPPRPEEDLPARSAKRRRGRRGRAASEILEAEAQAREEDGEEETQDE